MSYCGNARGQTRPDLSIERAKDTSGQTVSTPTAPVVKTDSVEHVTVIGDSHTNTLDRISGVDDNTINRQSDIGPLGKVKLAKLPFSIMKTPHSVIMNQQVRSMDQAFAYMPSVQVEARSDPSLTRMVNRGYESDTIANSRIDGLNALAITPYATEQFNNLTVLNGAAGAIYGPENPAGVLDMTQKRPMKSSYLNLNFNYDSEGSPMESLDGSYTTGPIGVRLNMLNQTGTGYVKGSHQWRDMISGDIDIHLSKKTVLELDASEYSEGLRGYPGYFSINQGSTIPNAPSMAHRGYGQSSAGGDYSTRTGTMKLKHKFNDKWSLNLGGLYQDSSRNVFTITNNITDSSACAGGICDQQTISTATNGQDFQTWSNSAYLNGEFNTGSIFGEKIVHHVNLGSNGYSLNNFGPTSVDDAIPLYPHGSPGVSFFDPAVIDNAGQTRKSGNYRAVHIQQQSLVVGDTVDIGKWVSVMTELSWGWIQTQNYGSKFAQNAAKTQNIQRNPNVLSSKQSVDGAFSPSVGFVFHATKNLNAYFNWGQSVQAGPIANAGSNINQVLPIIHSEQYEGGIKYTYKNRLQLNLDGFVMSRPYAYLNTQTNIEGLYGNQKESGIEFQMSGRLTKDLSVLGGATWLHSSLGSLNTGKTTSASGIVNNGRVVGVPKWSADVMLDYKVPVIKSIPRLKGLAFNTNIHYVGQRSANVQGTDYAKGYVTLNLGARYSAHIYNHLVVFRFNVDNVTGEKYWSSIFANGPAAGGVGKSGTTAAAGMPRTWHLSSSVFF